MPPMPPSFPAPTHHPLAARLILAGLLIASVPPSVYAQATSSAPNPLATVVVTGQAEADAGGQIAKSARAGLLGEKDLLDTPFSVNSYTSQRMLDQQALTLAEVLDHSLNDKRPANLVADEIARTRIAAARA